MKKSKTYILLVVVVIVWGFLLFKVYKAFFGEKDQILIQYNRKEKRLEDSSPIDTTQIEYPNRDPFLGTLYKPKSIVETITRPKPRKIITYDSIFSGIIYKGYMQSKKDSSYLYIINYNQRSLVLKPNDKFGEITFLGGDAEGIQVKFKTKTKTIKIAK